MKTIYPPNPAKNFNEWQDHIRTPREVSEFDQAADKFEADFMRMWLQFRESVVNARTK